MVSVTLTIKKNVIISLVVVHFKSGYNFTSKNTHQNSSHKIHSQTKMVNVDKFTTFYLVNALRHSMNSEIILVVHY